MATVWGTALAWAVAILVFVVAVADEIMEERMRLLPRRIKSAILHKKTD